MAVDFYFADPSFEIPSATALRDAWRNVPDNDVLHAIAYEAQYLAFHRFLLDQIHFTKLGALQDRVVPWVGKLDLSTRAGAVKAAVLISASIAEAVLRAHAERRGYKLPAAANRRTFGTVLEAWTVAGQPRPELTPYWDALMRLQASRNNIHLHKAANDPAAYYAEVLKREVETLREATEILEHLKTLQTA